MEPKSLRVSTHIPIPYFRVSSFPNEVTGFSVTAHQGWALQSFMRFMTLWNSVLALHIVLSVSFQRYLALSWAFNYLLLQFTLSLCRIPSNSTILMYNLLPIISKCPNHCTGERIFLSSGCSQSSVAIFLVAEQWSCAKDYSGPTYHLDGDSPCQPLWVIQSQNPTLLPVFWNELCYFKFSGKQKQRQLEMKEIYVGTSLWKIKRNWSKRENLYF